MPRILRAAVSSLYNRIPAMLMFVLIAIRASAQTFTPSTIPDQIFPLPTGASPAGTTTAPCPYTYAPPRPFLDRFRGTCVRSSTMDYDLDGIHENVSIWGATFGTIKGIEAAIAFEIREEGSTTPLQTGFYGLPMDMSNLQVGYTYALAVNGGDFKHLYDVWAVYWSGFYYLDRFRLDPDPASATAGLTRISHTFLTAYSPPGGQSRPLSLYTSADARDCIIAWEEPNGIHLKGLSSSHGITWPDIYPISADYLVPGTAGCTFPDVAVESAVWGGGSGSEVHLVYLNAAKDQIIKGRIGYGTIMGTPFLSVHGFVIDDVEPISTYNPALDGFQLQLAVRSEVSTTHNIPWAYTYYNDDGNKIKLRMQAYNRATDPPTTPVTYTLNDGSLGNGDIATNFGNAFPTITYVSERLPAFETERSYNQIMVAWYTNYDPSVPGNCLYGYSGDSKRYVAVKLSEDPTLISPLITDYMEISNTYTTNDIGARGNSINTGVPFVCLAPQNDAYAWSKVFCTFSGHGTTDIWNYPTSSAGHSFSFPADPPPGPVLSRESYYIAYKEIENAFTKTSFRPGPTGTASPVVTQIPLEVFPSIFDNTTKFRFKEQDRTMEYDAVLYSLEGKKLFQWKGNTSGLNAQISNTGFTQVAPGFLFLSVTDHEGKTQYFKLIKQ